MTAHPVDPSANGYNICIIDSCSASVSFSLSLSRTWICVYWLLSFTNSPRLSLSLFLFPFLYPFSYLTYFPASSFICNISNCVIFFLSDKCIWIGCTTIAPLQFPILIKFQTWTLYLTLTLSLNLNSPRVHTQHFPWLGVIGYTVSG